jgi:hypothetical protein
MLDPSVIGTEAAVEEAAAAELPAEVTASFSLSALEVEEVRGVYPDFDPEAALADPTLGALLRGELRPTLRQLYEAVHLDAIVDSRVACAVEARVAEAVEAAVSEAVAATARETEERLLGHIRARGQRPAEGGVRAASGIRMHPAVGRLTRRERAILAKRAENGETIQF